MSIVGKIKRAVRGEVNARTAALEALRRSRVAMARRSERARIEESGVQTARLRESIATLQSPELVAHFRNRLLPAFLPGFTLGPDTSSPSQSLLSNETADLIADADRIVSDHTWPLLGLGLQSFGAEIDWHKDPLSGQQWPLDYHADMNLNRGDGSDARVLWELNRLPHLITLARAYALTKEDRYTREFLGQVESWQSQNPYGYGANWNCAMEVALRAINLLGAFEIFRRSDLLDESGLAMLLALFDQHGTFIRRNLEFSYLVTSNHYLSDVVGLVWLGILLPELEAAAAWREFGLREMLREMDKQVLADGADFEAATGYHRFVLELFLYTFVLCRTNAIKIDDRYWAIMRKMLEYMHAYLRPDGRAPLVGDSDGGQVFPIRTREADDHAYVLAVGAVTFKDANLVPSGIAVPEEVSWLFGQQGVDDYKELESRATKAGSRGFPVAGMYVLRAEELSLVFNASDAGLGGRGSHGHNDALGIEVSACGVPFVVDPGTYIYTANLKERHAFRSTAYHSTVQIDRADQNTTEEKWPFVIGNEAKPRVLLWETGESVDRVSAEHHGYCRLSQPVTHRRTITFQKQQRWWLIDDEFFGSGEHEVAARFHLNSGVEVSLANDIGVWAEDQKSGSKLFIGALDLTTPPEFENQFTSTNYASKVPSITVCWQIRAAAPLRFRWLLIPACAGVDNESGVAIRFEQAKSYLDQNQ